jgi:hypothetical protein
MSAPGLPMRRRVTEKLRWTRAAAVLALIAAALLALVIVTNRVGTAGSGTAGSGTAGSGTVSPSAVMPAPLPNAPVVGPAALGGTLILTGDPGFRAQLRVVRGAGSFTVHVRNLGTEPFDGALRSGVWVATDTETLIGPSAVRPASASALTPGSSADRVLVFPAPDQARPAQLRITLHLGEYFPTAIWDLGS